MCEYIFDSRVGERNYDSYTGYAWTKIRNPIKDSSTGRTQYDDGKGDSDTFDDFSDARGGLDNAFSAYEDAVARRNNMIIGLASGGGVCLCCCIGGIVFCCMKLNKKDAPIVVQPVNTTKINPMIPGRVARNEFDDEPYNPMK